MNITDIANHVRSLDPAIPGYEISAYALELLEKIRLSGREKRINLSGSGKSIPIPGNVQTVLKVWKNGTLVPQTLPDEETFGTDELSTEFTYLTDADGAYLTDIDGSLLVE